MLPPLCLPSLLLRLPPAVLSQKDNTFLRSPSGHVPTAAAVTDVDEATATGSVNRGSALGQEGGGAPPARGGSGCAEQGACRGLAGGLQSPMREPRADVCRN